MPLDTRWTTVNDFLVEYFHAHHAQLPVPSEALSPDGSGWESAPDDTRSSADDDWLGSYKAMSSPGCIRLDFQRLLRFAASIAADVGRTAPLSLVQRERIFVSTGYVTYQHELFHHYCDLVRTMHGPQSAASGSLVEEALAVAFSWHRLNAMPDLLQGISVPERGQLVALMFGYRQPGYRDWVDFKEWHRFLRCACEHMWGEAATKLARNNFFLEPFLKVLFADPSLTHGSVDVFREPGHGALAAPLSEAPMAEPPTGTTWDPATQEAWLSKYVSASWRLRDDGFVDVDGDVMLRNLDVRELPVKFGRIRGTFDCAGNGLASVVGLPKQVDGDLICCDNRFASLAEINWVVEHVGGQICFHDNPLCSNVLGLALIRGSQRASLDPHPVVRRVFAEHEGEQNDNAFTIQAKLIDAGLDPFGEL